VRPQVIAKQGLSIRLEVRSNKVGSCFTFLQIRILSSASFETGGLPLIFKGKQPARQG